MIYQVKHIYIVINETMKIEITQKQLISAHIILFVVSFVFLEYSKMFRMNQKLHWIYSWGHNWWIMLALPTAFWGSLILGGYTLWKVKKNKFLYLFLSFLPILLFLILFFF